MKNHVLLLFALGFVAAACSGSDSSTQEPAAPSTAAVVTTTQASTTTAADLPATTTTAPATAAEELSVVEWEDDDGWRYEIAVFYVGESVEGAPLGCVGTPSPGKTNLLFDVRIANLIADREAPHPKMSFTVNLLKDGSIATNRSTYDLEGGERYIGDKAEVSPVPADTQCDGYAHRIPTDEPIPSAGISTFRVTTGPIPLPFDGLVFSYRMFPGGGLRWTSVDTPLDDPSAFVVIDGDGL